MKTFLKNKTVLVTGGTGTFGQAFVAKLLREGSAKKIIIFSRDEFKQSEMQRNLKDPKDQLRFFLGDVRDLSRLNRALRGVDIVVHAAALKQVPALEYNPLEAIKTNILGTQNVIDASLDNDVEKVLFISTDKAVHPINLYGATKLCAEKLIVAANAYSPAGRKTKFSVVRYGNVFGSRGSLIELIEKQKSTGIVTLTDKRMTRFWINVEKVMDMVFSGLEKMSGGEIFVPKMRSFVVVDVLSALAPKCKVKTIGIRPGEKLHEILITEHEVLRTKDVGDMFVIKPEFGWNDDRWLAGKIDLPLDFTYISNNSVFLLSSGEVKNILSKNSF